MMKSTVLATVAMLTVASIASAGDRDQALVVTSSNTVNNQLLVYDTAGNLVESVPTLGQGGVSGNAGSVAANNGTVAVANFGSQNVSLFSLADTGFELRQLVPTTSQPVMAIRSGAMRPS